MNFFRIFHRRPFFHSPSAITFQVMEVDQDMVVDMEDIQVADMVGTKVGDLEDTQEVDTEDIQVAVSEEVRVSPRLLQMLKVQVPI